jgi:predicted transcriptional regulator
MPRGNPSPKLAITVDPDVHAKVIAAAEADEVSVSAWMTLAAREALRRREGLAAIAEWEAQHGRLTDDEMHEARRRVLGQRRPGRAKRST